MSVGYITTRATKEPYHGEREEEKSEENRREGITAAMIDRVCAAMCLPANEIACESVMMMR